MSLGQFLIPKEVNYEKRYLCQKRLWKKKQKKKTTNNNKKKKQKKGGWKFSCMVQVGVFKHPKHHSPHPPLPPRTHPLGSATVYTGWLLIPIAHHPNLQKKNKKNTTRSPKLLHNTFFPVFFFFFFFYKYINWASSWDYGTYHIGDQRRLRPRAFVVRTHDTWSMEVSMEVDEGSDQKSDI